MSAKERESNEVKAMRILQGEKVSSEMKRQKMIILSAL